MEDLLEYHGFSVKEFDEPYMFKERQFLNGDSEYPIKFSKLVHLKRSATVVEDVVSSSLITSLPPEVPKLVQVSMASIIKETPVIHKGKTQVYAKPIDNHMANFGGIASFKKDMPGQPIFATPVLEKWNQDHRYMEAASHMEVASLSPRDIFKNNNSYKSPKVVTTTVVKTSFDNKFRNSLEKNDQSSAIRPHATPKQVIVETLPDIPMDSPVEDSMVQPVLDENLEPEEPESVIQEVPNDNEIDTSVDEEVAEAKLKLILRS